MSAPTAPVREARVPSPAPRSSASATASRRTRAVHPAAWWVWALGLAVAASSTTNPLLLVLVLAVSTSVVLACRGDDPWARAFRWYLLLGLLVVALRLVLHVLVGFKDGEHVVLRLPSLGLPSWAAGIEVGGTLTAEGLLSAGVQGLRLACVVVAVGAANALADPKRLLRALPGALHEIGVAVVVSVSVAPQAGRGGAARVARPAACAAAPVAVCGRCAGSRCRCCRTCSTAAWPWLRRWTRAASGALARCRRAPVG
ncbi:hypothetical protein GCM10025868_42770 [Angustibacter aerolatus]|uniref:Energy-coupling factor transporter transmembrane protein EcfT n=1 Tax=Angustibacter aerolatus TaxID=1162965 RepID=A0ABQ6JQA5_9ACTN|nr:hypothetical protein GCM10025868_42770 [Angustibacter aerolatus]